MQNEYRKNDFSFDYGRKDEKQNNVKYIFADF